MKIGFCGLGLMGTAMARRLIQSGHDVAVWNRDLAKAHLLAGEGARVATSPARAAIDADIAILCVKDEVAVEEITFGANGLAENAPAFIVDHSSISPHATQSIAARLTSARWIDAPVSGGVAGVEAGALAIMMGGDVEAVTAVKPVLSAYGRNLTHMGVSGKGQIAKLCNQAIVAATLVAIGEAVALARRTGIDADILVAALKGGWADSILLQTWAPLMAAPDGQMRGALGLLSKDIDNIRAAAREVSTLTPVSDAVSAFLRDGAEVGAGARDISAIADLLCVSPSS